MTQKFQSIPIRIASGENKSRSAQWSSQSCINMYPDIQASGRTESALLPWPGETVFSIGTSGTLNRGMHVVAGVPYTLIDRSLYRITETGLQQYIADVPGAGYASFADDGVNLLIRSEGTATYINGKFILQGPGATFLWNGSTLQTLTLPNINQDEFLVSDVDAPTVYTGYSPGKSQVSGGDYKQVYRFQQKIFFAGESVFDVYYDDTSGNPPIKPVTQASSSEVGVASPYSMAQTPSFLYMLGSDGVAYRLSNFETQVISSSAISKVLRESNTDNALGVTVQLDGQWFYIVQLRGDNVTLAYSETTNEWVRLSSGVQLGRHIMEGYTFAYGRHLICDATSSTIYEWDFNEFTRNGSPIIRQFQTAPVNGLMIGAPGRRILMSRCRFIMESGVGNADKFDPQMMVSYSTDGGKTFKDENWLKMKRAGESTTLVDWNKCVSFYDLVLRVKVSDPVFTSFHSAVIEVKDAGN